MKNFASKPSNSTKNHRRGIFQIFKTLSKLSAIFQSKNQGRTTRRSDNIEPNVKMPLK